MGNRSSLLKYIPLEVACILITIFIVTSCGDCYEDPNLVIPPVITAQYGDVELVPFKREQAYIGTWYYPYGTDVKLLNGTTVINRFFSLRRYDSYGNSITFYWNDNTPPPFNVFASKPFHLPEKGELISLYMAIFNIKYGNIDCIYKDSDKVESVLDLKVVVKDEEVIGEQKVIQTIYNVPAGGNKVFKFDFKYNGNGLYNFNVNFTADGIIETDTIDNNYSVSVNNLGL